MCTFIMYILVEASYINHTILERFFVLLFYLIMLFNLIMFDNVKQLLEMSFISIK